MKALRSSVVQRRGVHCCSRPVPLPKTRALPVTLAAAADASPRDVQYMLAQKEAQLQALFQSGQPMPTASQVAQLRQEITALDAQLRGQPVGSYMPMDLGMPSAAATAPAPAPGMHTHIRARSRTEELADKAYEMVEQQLRSNQGMGASDDIFVAQLEAENTQLRVRAYELLQRQQHLESLLAEIKGIKPPEMLIETTEDILNRMKAKLQKTNANGQFQL